MRISSEEIIELLLNFIDEGDRVLDADCGDCSRLKEIKNFKDINAFGVDILIPKLRDSEIIVDAPTFDTFEVHHI